MVVRVLIACEYSGVLRDRFSNFGFDAWSCDLFMDTESQQTVEENKHYKGDVLDIINDGWDLMIAHPPCTYMCSSGLHWNKRVPGRDKLTEESLEFVRILLNAPIEHIALENPVGCISTRIKKASQYIQPYEYGDDASKKTGLWLKNLPLLKPTKFVEPRIVNGKKRWSNQTDSGQNKLAPSETRWVDRSRTYPGIADAIVDQFGNYLLSKLNDE